MENQLRLFDQPPLNPWQSATARQSDPETSHEAAERVTRTGKAFTHRVKLLDAIHEHPGSTCGELAELVGLDRAEASKRLPELRRDGYAKNGESRVCKIQKTRQITWWPIW